MTADEKLAQMAREQAREKLERLNPHLFPKPFDSLKPSKPITFGPATIPPIRQPVEPKEDNHTGNAIGVCQTCGFPTDKGVCLKNASHGTAADAGDMEVPF